MNNAAANRGIKNVVGAQVKKSVKIRQMTEVEEGDQLMEESLSQTPAQPQNSNDPFTKFSGTFDETKKQQTNRIQLLDKFSKSLNKYE